MVRYQFNEGGGWVTAVPRTSLAVYKRARTILQAYANQVAREHPLAALLGLLINRSDLPQLGDAGAAGSAELTPRMGEVFRKLPPFDEGAGPGAEMRRAGFGSIAPPGQNDWRNALGSQKGLGCFANTAELSSPAFRHANRPDCPHRQSGADGDRCVSSPLQSGEHTRCRSVEQHAGEVPKLVQITPAAGGTYQYRLVLPDGPDLRKLLSGNDRIPLWPFLQSLYGGSSLREAQAVVTSTEFFADLGVDAGTAAELFDASTALPPNQEIVRMTEPYLLSSLRCHLFDRGFSVSLPDLINFYLSLKPRGFVILSGISGTGKSQLPRLFAELVLPPGRPALDNFESVPVRPAWNDVADLMGYYNSIHGGFEPGPVLEAFRKAASNEGGIPTDPVILLLDELNLSRVEHYFADFLSVMESRRLIEDAWVTDPLRLAGGRTGDLEFVGKLVEDESLPYVNFVAAELQIPDNLFVVGTVNIDESTQGISSKVLDRANTIEFDTVDFTPVPPTPPDGYLEADLQLLGSSLVNRPYRTLAAARAAHPTLVSSTIEKLTEVNVVLSDWRLHFGMRTRDEICIYLAYAQDLCTMAESSQVDLDGFDMTEALDRQILQKILPRITGTREELHYGPGGNLFDRLGGLLAGWAAGASVAKAARMSAQELANFWEA